MSTPEATSLWGPVVELAMVVPSVTVTSPCVFGVRLSLTAASGAPSPKLGLSIIR